MLSYRDGQLYLEGKSVKSLAEELGTPFFLISDARLRSNYNALTRGLSHPEVKPTVRYCAKTNNEPGVLAIMASLGSQVVVSHAVEAQVALGSGFAPEMIAYQRPLLLEDEVRAVVGAGVSLVHVYRLEDLPVIEKAASECGRRLKLSLRLRNNSLGARSFPLNFLTRRLGLTESDILSAAKRIRDSEWLSLAAINFHGGTQQESVRIYRALLRRVTRLGVRLQAQMGVALEEINLGGGIPSPSLRRIGVRSLWLRIKDDLAYSNASEKLEEFSRMLSAEFRNEANEAGLRPLPALVVEPGRAIVGNAAVLVTRVRAVQGKWAFLDASSNYLGESPLLFARQVLPINQPGDGEERYYHLSGSTLNTTDIVDVRRRLPTLAVGDVLVLCDAGAYSISRASRYAGLSPAVHLLQTDGSLRMIRRAETLADLTSHTVRDEDGEGVGDG